jgi:hypothetical protein
MTTEIERRTADLRSLLAVATAAVQQYGRSKGRVVPEMEYLGEVVDALWDTPAYRPTTWCYMPKDYHVTPHRGCILR